ncbi:MAG: hypothetical protein HUU54_04680 [Ignavibacteriaceae bacterium]|nr:hypothetical protein [Ignavibacteriaceae bacterium]
MYRLIFIILLTLSYCVQSSAQQDELFNRLPGVWEMKKEKSSVIEEWEIISQYEMSGKSYMVMGKDTTLLETITIRKSKSGLEYMPVVTGQNKNKAVRFLLKPKPVGAFIFENKKHDYPQRIIYRFISDDSLHARIEGKKKGKKRSGDFYYGRIE